MANATNYVLEGEERDRVEALWARTGQDWSYADTVAGLWAYNATLGGEISQKPGSPVAQIALMLGRTVSGAYNKLMNFRAIDPRDPRTGLPATSAMDDLVWKRFFETSVGLRSDLIEEEFQSLWPSERRGVAQSAHTPTAAVVDEVADGLAKRYTLEELLDRFAAGEPGFAGRCRSRSRSSWTRTFARNALVVAIAKLRAGSKCEVERCAHPAFLGFDGLPYVEVHHIEPLAEGGPDTPENTVCLCPAHHREAHFGKRAAELAAAFRQLRSSSPA